MKLGFGSKYYNVKEFNHKNVKEKEKSDIIRSNCKARCSRWSN